MSIQEAPAANPSEPLPRIIYELTERDTHRQYIGVTHRPLQVRIAAHLTQARRDKPVRPDGLMAALRRMLAAGKTFKATFDARIVDHAATEEEARQKERRWIETSGCAQPVGFNEMPGGSSLGGPANSRPVTVEIDGTMVTYSSFYEALSARNRALKAAGSPIIETSAAYARLAANWPAEEVLGYRPHDDGRGVRPLFYFDGQPFTSLRAASIATGLPLDTLRTRGYRRRNEPDGNLDIGLDRRKQGKGRAALEELRIPWPGTDEHLTAAEFGQRTGIAKATVIHRWHRIRSEEAQREEQDLPPLMPLEVHERLTAEPAERRKVLALLLPDGRIWRGGERELIRQLFADYAIEASRTERLSESGIRRRLRHLADDERNDPKLVRHAFGFTTGDAATDHGSPQA